MNDPLKLAEKQTLRYWYVDGLTELATGTLLVCLALLNLGLWLLGPSTAADWLQGAGQPLLIVAGALLGRMAINRLKEHLTYPRTGYIAYRSSPRHRRLLVTLAAAGLAGLFAVALVSLKAAWLAQFAPAILAAVLTAYLGYSYGLKRFYVLAGFTALLSLPMTLLPLNDKSMMVLFLGALALGWLASGAWTLRSYLSQTRPDSEAG